MNEIITVQNVRGYCDENGTAWLNAADVARGLGWTRTETKNGKEYTSILWHRVNGYLGEFGFRTDVCETDYLPENIVYRLAMKASNETAQVFQAKVADDILPTIRRTGSYTLKPKAVTPFADKVVDIGETARALEKYITGLKSGMALAQAIAFAEVNDNLNYEPIKQLIPPAEHKTGYLNATQIGERLGLGKGAVAGRKANVVIKDCALQVKEGNDWRLTDEGTAYGEEVPYSRNGHSGYQIRWNESVLEILEENLRSG